MKKYNTPIAELVELKIADIVTLSGEYSDEKALYDDVKSAPNWWFN